MGQNTRDTQAKHLKIHPMITIRLCFSFSFSWQSQSNCLNNVNVSILLRFIAPSIFASPNMSQTVCVLLLLVQCFLQRTEAEAEPHYFARTNNVTNYSKHHLSASVECTPCVYTSHRTFVNYFKAFQYSLSIASARSLADVYTSSVLI